jgi:hypothetical protein
VEFEDELSIPVMKTGQFFTKIYNWKSQSFGKSQAARSLYFKPRHFRTLVHIAIGQDWGAPVHVRVSKLTGTYSKK